MNASPILLQKKYSRIIVLFAEQANISLREALDFFYRSLVYDMMKNGIADYHCMSDGYLSEDLTEEYKAKHIQDGAIIHKRGTFYDLS